jgi:uncharacterized protein (TIGR02145 family)
LNAEAVMQYNEGDRLKLTGKSGIYSTVITDVPTVSKAIAFMFFKCTDGDGNNYPVVRIGGAKGTTENQDSKEDNDIQTWMAENLKTTQYIDKTDIPWVINGYEWSGQGYIQAPAYTWYYNSDITYGYTYGAMYNWYAVNTGKICPTGWHIPSSEEWFTLVTNLGGEIIAGGKLKETGTNHWESPNTGATNESGFTALPGGLRNDDGGYFDGIGFTGFFWSSSSINNSTAFTCDLFSGTNRVQSDNKSKAFGLSVRCMKDKPEP